MSNETLILYKTTLLCAVSMGLAGWVFLLKSQIRAVQAENAKLRRELKRIRGLVEGEVQVLSSQRLNARLDPAQPDAFQQQR